MQEGFAHDATVFRWTNAVYLRMQDVIASGGKSAAR
jgi:hypothetical protein